MNKLLKVLLLFVLYILLFVGAFGLISYFTEVEVLPDIKYQLYIGAASLVVGLILFVVGISSPEKKQEKKLQQQDIEINEEAKKAEKLADDNFEYVDETKVFSTEQILEAEGLVEKAQALQDELDNPAAKDNHEDEIIVEDDDVEVALFDESKLQTLERAVEEAQGTVVEEVEAVIEETVEASEEVAEDTTEAIEDTVEAATEEVIEEVEETEEVVEQVAEEVEAATEEAVVESKDIIEEVAEEVADEIPVKDFAETTEEIVEEVEEDVIRYSIQWTNIYSQETGYVASWNNQGFINTTELEEAEVFDSLSSASSTISTLVLCGCDNTYKLVEAAKKPVEIVTNENVTVDQLVEPIGAQILRNDNTMDIPVELDLTPTSMNILFDSVVDEIESSNAPTELLSDTVSLEVEREIAPDYQPIVDSFKNAVENFENEQAQTEVQPEEHSDVIIEPALHPQRSNALTETQVVYIENSENSYINSEGLPQLVLTDEINVNDVEKLEQQVKEIEKEAAKLAEIEKADAEADEFEIEEKRDNVARVLIGIMVVLILACVAVAGYYAWSRKLF